MSTNVFCKFAIGVCGHIDECLLKYLENTPNQDHLCGYVMKTVVWRQRSSVGNRYATKSEWQACKTTGVSADHSNDCSPTKQRSCHTKMEIILAAVKTVVLPSIRLYSVCAGGRVASKELSQRRKVRHFLFPFIQDTGGQISCCFRDS